ncbi:hypothetical protein ElyMa_002756100 [Elysia marginata]|uniref:Reverse transcriptase domain-containing protein n=1 Tax=Elysia marginata TaxID=1093978 RepID=A0AAV4HJM8_9GAST|nr:hypothetical protein ElyMa_002756100 [Elysia marginata]
MATPSGIRPSHPLNLKESPIEGWKLFKQSWENYVVITDILKKDNKYQKAMFLHCIGPDALKVYNTFNLAEDGTTKLQDIIAKFENFIIGETNETYERYKFNQRNQLSEETTDQFITALKTLSSTCNFCDCMKESLLRDRLVTGIRNPETRKKLLERRKLALQDAIDICRATESSASQIKEMDHRQTSSDTINKIVKQPSRPFKVRPTSAQATCKFCGGQHQFLKSKCPAYGKVCSKCGGRNHFAKVCKKTQKKPHKAAPKVRNVKTDSDSESSSDWMNSIKGTIKCNMLVKGKPVAFLIDSGASVNLLPIKYATHLVASSTKPLRSYCDTIVDTKGISRQVIKNPKTGKNYSVEFVVVDNECQPVIGLKAARQMKLLVIKENNFEQVASLANNAIFNGELGSLPGKQHLTVDSSVATVIMPDRRVPIAMKAKLKTELGDMVKRGIITPMEEPTPWVSQLVVTPKPNGRLRVCLDPKFLNKALQREHYTMPILDDILHDLSSSKVFTKADLQNGYWHVQLDEESSRLTTFQTCFGRFRFLRLPFGLNVSAEIFLEKNKRAAWRHARCCLHERRYHHSRDKPTGT